MLRSDIAKDCSVKVAFIKKKKKRELLKYISRLKWKVKVPLIAKTKVSLTKVRDQTLSYIQRNNETQYIIRKVVYMKGKLRQCIHLNADRKVL